MISKLGNSAHLLSSVSSAAWLKEKGISRDLSRTRSTIAMVFITLDWISTQCGDTLQLMISFLPLKVRMLEPSVSETMNQKFLFLWLKRPMPKPIMDMKCSRNKEDLKSISEISLEPELQDMKSMIMLLLMLSNSHWKETGQLLLFPIPEYQNSALIANLILVSSKLEVEDSNSEIVGELQLKDLNLISANKAFLSFPLKMLKDSLITFWWPRQKTDYLLPQLKQSTNQAFTLLTLSE